MPGFTEVLRNAVNRSPSTSLLGPASAAFQEKFLALLASLLGQSAKPSWCLEVSTTYFAPDASISFAHSSGLYNSALKSGANW